jgi:hypothetical protein
MFSRSIGICICDIEQVAYDILASLSNRGCQGRKYSGFSQWLHLDMSKIGALPAVLVLDAHTSGKQQLDAFELPGNDGHFNHSLEGTGVRC